MDILLEVIPKYGGYCCSIAYNILSNREDSEKSVSDTYLAAWNSIPPGRPHFLNARTVTEEEAMAVRNSYQRIVLDMKLFSEYPLS